MQNKFLSIIAIVMLIIYVAYCTACKKFLDEKPSSSLSIPSSVKDFQAMIDLHGTHNSGSPVSSEISADNYYLNDDDWKALPENYRLMHTWQPGDIFLAAPNEWSNIYRSIFYMNTILENAKTLN